MIFAVVVLDTSTRTAASRSIRKEHELNELTTRDNDIPRGSKYG